MRPVVAVTAFVTVALIAYDEKFRSTVAPASPVSECFTWEPLEIWVTGTAFTEALGRPVTRKVYVARYSDVFTAVFALPTKSWFAYVTWSPELDQLPLVSNTMETASSRSALVGHDDTAAGVSHTIELSGAEPLPICPVCPSTVIVSASPSFGFVVEAEIATVSPELSATLFDCALIVSCTLLNE